MNLGKISFTAVLLSSCADLATTSRVAPTERDDLAQWFTQLAHEDPTVVRQAADAIAASGAETVPRLLALLEPERSDWYGVVLALEQLESASEVILPEIRARCAGHRRPTWYPTDAHGQTHYIEETPLSAALTRLIRHYVRDRDVASPVLFRIVSDELGRTTSRFDAWSRLRDRYRDRTDHPDINRPEVRGKLRALARNERSPQSLRDSLMRWFIERGDHDLVRELTSCQNDWLRYRAHRELARLVTDGRSQRKGYYRDLLTLSPADPNAGRVLFDLIGSPSTDLSLPPDPLEAELKQELRRRLAEQPDVETALALASVIQYQLLDTEIYRSTGGPQPLWLRRFRRDSAESYSTLRAALETGLSVAAAGSDHHEEVVAALQRLALIEGDWQRLNEWRILAGQDEILAEDRPWLTAPHGLTARSMRWISCDEAWRTGPRTLRVRIEKGEDALPGAHVLVTERRFNSGSGQPIDTMMFSPTALPTLFGTIGYRCPWTVGQTRYAISDQSGEVVIEGLPEVELRVDLLIPTAGFEESTSRWDLELPREAREAVRRSNGDIDLGTLRLIENPESR